MNYVFNIDIDGARYRAKVSSDQYAITVSAKEIKDKKAESIIDCTDSIITRYPLNILNFDEKYVPFCTMITVMRLLATKKYINLILSGEPISLTRRNELFYAYCRAVKYFGRDYTIDKLREFIKYPQFKSDKSILKFINTVLIASYYEWIYDYYFMSDQVHFTTIRIHGDTGLIEVPEMSHGTDLSEYMYCDTAPAKKRNPKIYKQHYIEYRIAMLKLFTTYKKIVKDKFFERLTNLIGHELPLLNERRYFNELF